MSDNLLTRPVTIESADLTVTDVHMRDRSGETWKSRLAKDRLYIFADDWSVMDHLSGRWTQPVKQYRKMLPAILKTVGLEGVKATWSQYAGCSCGCSPGFVLESHSGDYRQQGMIYADGLDIYVTFQDDAARREQIKAQFSTFIDA